MIQIQNTKQYNPEKRTPQFTRSVRVSDLRFRISNLFRISDFVLRILIVVISLWLLNFGEAHAALIQKPPSNLGLVGYWSMNEGTGSYAGDASGNKNQGTLVSGPTWVDGKRGKALSFDGSDDKVLFSDPVVGSNFTFGAWIKPSSNFGTSGDGIFDTKPAAVGALRVFGNTGTPAQLCWDIGGNAPDQCVNDTGYNISDWTNQWHHIVLVLSGNSTTILYVDGVNVGTVSNSVSASSNTFLVGVYNNTNYFSGLIDEVRVYNRALSAAEIQALYKSGAAKFAASPTNLGLVGYWSMNEGTSTIAGDFSGKGNNGTLTSMSSPPTATSGWTTSGKRGGALNFDGTNDLVNAGSAAILDDISSKTVSAWINPRSGGGLNIGHIVSKRLAGGGGEAFYMCGAFGAGLCSAGNRLAIILGFSGGNGIWESGENSVSLNKWQHVVFTHDRSSSTNDPVFYVNGVVSATTETGTPSGSMITDAANSLLIGNNDQNSADFNGLIDEVRVYNRVLSAAEVLALYQADYAKINAPQNNQITNGLVGMWSFNGPDISGTTAFDRSGQGNNGTLTNGPTLAPGKVGQALSFDGANDQILVNGNVLNPGSSLWAVAAWIKTDSNGFILCRSDFANCNTNDGADYYSLSVTNGKAVFSFGGGGLTSNAFATSTTSINDDRWHHVVGIRSALKTGKIFVDGVQEDMNTYSGSATSISPIDPLYIGAKIFSSEYFKGTVDEVRIYNRVLTEAEIKRLYNMGR